MGRNPNFQHPHATNPVIELALADRGEQCVGKLLLERITDLGTIERRGMACYPGLPTSKLEAHPQTDRTGPPDEVVRSTYVRRRWSSLARIQTSGYGQLIEQILPV